MWHTYPCSWLPCFTSFLKSQLPQVPSPQLYPGSPKATFPTTAALRTVGLVHRHHHQASALEQTLSPNTQVCVCAHVCTCETRRPTISPLLDCESPEYRALSSWLCSCQPMDTRTGLSPDLRGTKGRTLGDKLGCSPGRAFHRHRLPKT